LDGLLLAAGGGVSAPAAPALAERIRGKLGRESKRLELRARRRRAGTEVLWVDYGWAELPFTDDGDEQEILYHVHQREWRAQELAALEPLVGPGATVLDVGANLGFYSALFAAQVGPRGRVVAFEPSPRVFAKLRATIARNRLDQVVGVNCGCGSAAGEAVLHQVSASTGSGSLVAGAAAGETVEIRRLDDIPEARERPPQLIKIDVEGFEPEVLAGARAILAEHRPLLYVELCGEYAESSVRSVALLDELGYDTRALARLDWAAVPNGSNFVVRPAGSAG
jgi:FkbM family methyltransferase